MSRNPALQNGELVAELERLRERERQLRQRSADLLESLRRAETERDRLFAISIDLICVLDADTRIRRLSPACQRVVGVPASDLLDRAASERVDEPDRREFKAEVAALCGGPTLATVTVEVGFRCGDGCQRPLLWSMASAGDGTCFAVVRDLSEQREAEARYRQLAQRDPLTRLPNRILFTDRLEQAIARAKRYDGRVAVLFVDIDRFKSVNDELGHEAGDTVLVTMADRMRRCVRSIDTVARYGGDEFVIVLQDVREPHGAQLVAARLLGHLAEPVVLPSGPRRGSASIGVAVYPMDGEDADSLVRAADAAMYRVKEAGGNDVRFSQVQ